MPATNVIGKLKSHIRNKGGAAGQARRLGSAEVMLASTIADEICRDSQGKERIYIDALKHVVSNSCDAMERTASRIALARMMSRVGSNDRAGLDLLVSDLNMDIHTADIILPIVNAMGGRQYMFSMMFFASRGSCAAYNVLSDYPEREVFSFFARQIAKKSYLDAKSLKFCWNLLKLPHSSYLSKYQLFPLSLSDAELREMESSINVHALMENLAKESEAVLIRDLMHKLLMHSEINCDLYLDEIALQLSGANLDTKILISTIFLNSNEQHKVFAESFANINAGFLSKISYLWINSMLDDEEFCCAVERHLG